MTGKVNIIIPVKSRPELLEQTVRSLFENTSTDDFNLYLFLDGVDHETRTAALGLVKDITRIAGWFHLHENEESQGPGWCRNTICRLIRYSPARAGYLYHSDADVYFMPGWLDALIEAYDKFPEVKLLGGGGHPYLKTNQRLERDGIIVNTKDAVPGFTAFMDWEVWDRWGPYDEHRDIMGSEDYKMCQDIIKDGSFVGVIEPELIVHCGKTNSRGEPATGHEHMTEIPGHPEIEFY